MNNVKSTIASFINSLYPFNKLPEISIEALAEKFKPVVYRIGETIIMRETELTHIMIVYKGEARLLGYDRRSKDLITLKKLLPGAILGSSSLLRGVYTETAIASTEVKCLALEVEEFENLLRQHENLRAALSDRPELTELCELLGSELESHADGGTNLKELTLKVEQEAIVVNVTAADGEQIKDSSRIWLISGGRPAPKLPVGSRFSPHKLENLGNGTLRVVGIPRAIMPDLPTLLNARTALNVIPPPQPVAKKESQEKKEYPHFQAKGSEDEIMTCLRMVSQYFKIPFHKEVLSKVIANQQRTGKISLMFFASIADLMGLQAQPLNITASQVARMPTPAIIKWEEKWSILWEINQKEAILGVPTEQNQRRCQLSTFMDIWGQQGQVLVLRAGAGTPEQKFGISWFIPVLMRYRRVLIEILLASFFVQLFGLLNPLIVKEVINAMIQGTLDSLSVFCIVLIIMAAFEAILNSLRTYLFTDTSNRIDLALGSQLIDHLMRLPMSYFGKRSMGELQSRVTELEKIRQFLTGTALNVVLDVLFSFLYIAVMLFFSVKLTFIALGIIPLYLGLTTLFSPRLRQLSRKKSERYAETQSYLAETLNGIETVKSQNIELRARMSWQERYGRYVSAGFKAVKLATINSSVKSFLNKVSTLLVLWIGAYIVVSGELTVGDLIAFRMISSQVTTPLLGLFGVWDQFQEVALSIERLSDILDHPEESPPEERNNITMPPIKGAVTYENISFRFSNIGALQLNQVNLNIPAGAFVGIVGQSGSGKSTLTKLLPRFYQPLGGRILVDGYDISRVELYSLRRQIGIVPQNPLLFDGTINDNITMNYPEATTEEIIAAAKIAQAHDFIMEMPNGYNSPVGERGSALSGGQRQRVAIARTILQNPQLLIFDEATSALDPETEEKVCNNIMQAFKGRTILFITHRLSTLKQADLAIMMVKGQIAEMGTPAELMALKGQYYILASK